MKPICLDNDLGLIPYMEEIAKLAVELGATATKVVKVEEVIVDERVRAKCAIPRCVNYGRSANCPPYTPNTDEVRKLLSKYCYALLVKKEVIPVEHFADRKMSKESSIPHYKQMALIISKLESKAFSDGFYLALGLGSGSCHHYLCGNQGCQFLESGKCRFSMKARPSMEAMSIDVFRTVTLAGWSIYPIGSAYSPVAPAANTVGILFLG